MSGGERGVVNADGKRAGESVAPRVADAPDTDRTGVAVSEGVETDPTGVSMHDPDSDRTLKPSTLSPTEARESAAAVAARAAVRRESAVRMASVPVISPDETLRTDAQRGGDGGDDDDDATQLDPRALALAHEDDATRLDPKAQAVALDELRHLSGEMNGPTVAPYAAVASANASVGGGAPAPHGPASNSPRHVEAPSDLLVQSDESEEETRGMGLDGAELFADVGGQRRVGGTALLHIITAPPAYSALPRDVSVFIKEDSIENLPPHQTSARRTVAACVVGISVAAIVIAGFYALLRPF